MKMCNSPLVSVIIPIYNADKYLCRCIDSILLQSYNNIEIILVNDGSSDMSTNICELYRAKSDKVKILHKHNEGVTAARRDGLKMAQGEWIMFVDADDTIPYDSISRLFKEIDSTDIDIVMGSWKKCYKNKKRLLPISSKGVYDSFNYVKALLLGYVFSGPVGKLYRRNLFDDDTFIISKEITKNEDLIMNLKIANNVTKVKILPQIVVYNYYQNEGSASRSYMPVKYFDLLFTELFNVTKGKYQQFVWSYISGVFLRHKNEPEFFSSIYYDKLLLQKKENSFLSVIWHNVNVVSNNSFYSNLYLNFIRLYKVIKKFCIFICSVIF